MAGTLTRKKARTILSEGKIGGRPLTPEQRGFFGLLASGKRKKIRKKSLLT